MNLERKTFTANIAGEELKIEASKIGGQANAAVIGSYGGTAVLVTAVMEAADREVNYLPLTVDYEEKFYAGGKILGSPFTRREGRPPESSVLSGRLIDRTIRPLFDKRIRRGIQIVATLLSYDGENDPDFLAVVTASVALGISDIPWSGPVAALRIAKLKGTGELLMNPKNDFMSANAGAMEFDTFVAGPRGKINMIELAGDEAAQASVMKAYRSALGEFEKIITFQEGIIESIGKRKEAFEFKAPGEKVAGAAREFWNGKIEKALFHGGKNAIYQLGDDLGSHLAQAGFTAREIDEAKTMYEAELDLIVHREILQNGRRPDGRRLDEIRELHAETGLLPRTHGSGLFIRGNTQALAITTLGAPGDGQIVETVEHTGKKRFMLHYNFPPYSVGETGRIGMPGRRDIGHGALAEKAILPLLPPKEVFPYTIRVVSEILSSNGSSSMATVCAASLSLMDAGVPIKAPAAGIAMGLIADESTMNEKSPAYKILTDLQGPEDHYGDMDFKVAGTKNGITAIQMDVKLQGVTPDILEAALEEAEKARMKILTAITAALPAPRKELSSWAPRILTLQIDRTRIGEVIGTGGKVVQEIIRRTGVAAIDIDDNGCVLVTAANPANAEKAIEEIKKILKEYSIGEIIEGNVIKILDFGAIVEFGGREGMIHVSELKEGFVKNVSDVLKVGDFVRAKIVKIENGRIALSIKQLGK